MKEKKLRVQYPKSPEANGEMDPAVHGYKSAGENSRRQETWKKDWKTICSRQHVRRGGNRKDVMHREQERRHFTAGFWLGHKSQVETHGDRGMKYKEAFGSSEREMTFQLEAGMKGRKIKAGYSVGRRETDSVSEICHTSERHLCTKPRLSIYCKRRLVNIDAAGTEYWRETTRFKYFKLHSLQFFQKLLALLFNTFTRLTKWNTPTEWLFPHKLIEASLCWLCI